MKKNVIFYSPGILFAESNNYDIVGDDLNEIIKNSLEKSKTITQRYGAIPYCFIIDKITYYLPHHKIKLLEDIKAENNPDNRILISNMECNGWNSVVESTKGWLSTQPFRNEDYLLDEDGSILIKGSQANAKYLRKNKLERILYNK